MPEIFQVLRFQCSQCGGALNLVAVDRTVNKIINIEFVCYNCLIESGIVAANEVDFLYVTGVKSAP